MGLVWWASAGCNASRLQPAGAIQARVLMDNGIFPFEIGEIVSVLLGGYYKCANVQIDCYEVITHKPQAGAYRFSGGRIFSS